MKYIPLIIENIAMYNKYKMTCNNLLFVIVPIVLLTVRLKVIAV